LADFLSQKDTKKKKKRAFKKKEHLTAMAQIFRPSFDSMYTELFVPKHPETASPRTALFIT